MNYSDDQVATFRQAAGLSPVFADERIRAGLAAVNVRRTPLTDGGVLVVLQVLDAAMDALNECDRARVARSFTNKYGNELSNADAPDLAPREWRTLRLLAIGKKTDEISQEMNAGVRTINTYIANLLMKLNANNRTHAVAEAYRRGML